MAHARPQFTVMRLLLIRGRSAHGRYLSDQSGSVRQFHKMNAGEASKVLRRGASVQQLGCTSILLTSAMEDFDHVSFAETFTTLSSSRKQKKLEDIKENFNNGTSEVSGLTSTIKDIFELKTKNTSSLSVERLVKKFCFDYDNLGKSGYIWYCDQKLEFRSLLYIFKTFPVSNNSQVNGANKEVFLHFRRMTISLLSDYIL